MSQVNREPAVAPVVVNDILEILPFIGEITHKFFDERNFRVCKTIMNINGQEFSVSAQMNKPVDNVQRVMATNITENLEQICKYIANGELDYRIGEQRLEIGAELLKEFEEE